MFMNSGFQLKWTSLVQKQASSNSPFYQPTCSFIFFTTHSFHFHSFSLGQMKLLVQNFWCPQQRQRPVSPSRSSTLSELLPVSFIISAVHPPLLSLPLYFLFSSCSALFFHCCPTDGLTVTDTYRNKWCTCPASASDLTLAVSGQFQVPKPRVSTYIYNIFRQNTKQILQAMQLHIKLTHIKAKTHHSEMKLQNICTYSEALWITFLNIICHIIKTWSLCWALSSATNSENQILIQSQNLSYLKWTDSLDNGGSYFSTRFES